MLELNIVTAPPPAPKPKPIKPQKKPAEPSDPSPPQPEKPESAAPPPVAAPPKGILKRKAAAAPANASKSDDPPPEKIAEPPATAPPPSAKRSRYATSSGSADAAALPREDPTRAAALPATLPLEPPASGSSREATFSATTFAQLPLDTYLCRHLTDKMALSNLTPVQQHAIPSLLRGNDLLVRSPTGSGKTLAYAVPIVQALLSRGPTVVTRAAGTFALVLVPTRELCLQTHEVIELLARPFPWLVTTMLMGGEKRKAEKARLRKGVALLVGTPGRVSDHCEATSAWKLDHCQHLVLDEADRLLDLGFQKSIDAILKALERFGGSSATAAAPQQRQTVLLSATLSKGLRELAGRSLTNYSTLQISSKGVELTPHGGSKRLAATSAADANDDAAAAPQLSEPATASPSAAAAAAMEEEADATPTKLDAPSGLVQSYALIPTRHRLTALLALIRSRCASSTTGGGSACKMIVFVSSCDQVDFLYELLAVSGNWPDKDKAALATGHADSVRAAIHEFKRTQKEQPEEDEEELALWGDVDSDLVGTKRKKPPTAAEKSGSKASSQSDASGGGKAGGDGLSFDCSLLGTTVLRLHGQMSQRDRTQAFVRFRRLSSGVLFATDVAARGLNLEGVHWIVQSDLPQDANEYIHRAGRTARLGQSGHAVLLLHPSELPFLSLLRSAGVSHLKELKFASLQAALCPNGSSGGGGGSSTQRKDVYIIEVALQKQLEGAVAERAFMAERACAAYQSYLRGYAALPKAVRRCVHVGQLHLGHLAKSFGLLEPPSKLSAQQSKKALKMGGGGRSEYLAGAEYLPREQRADPRDSARPKQAQQQKSKKLSLSERMQRQPKGRAAHKPIGGSGKPAAAMSLASEFAAG